MIARCSNKGLQGFKFQAPERLDRTRFEQDRIIEFHKDLPRALIASTFEAKYFSSKFIFVYHTLYCLLVSSD
jgi:hypothetical protein